MPDHPDAVVVRGLRGLLAGTPLGTDAPIALGWSTAIGLGGYLWSRHLFTRESLR